MFWGQKSNAAYGAVNLAAHWRHTYDPDFARRVLALETRQLQRVTRELPATPLG